MTRAWGLLAAALTLGLYAEYIRAVVCDPRNNSPARTSNLIWACQYVVMFAAAVRVAGHNTGSLWYLGASTLGVLTIFALSFPYGYGLIEPDAATGKTRIRLRTHEWVLLAGVAAALGWYLTSSAAVAIVLAVAVDQAAGSFTIRKAYRVGKEPLRAWLLCGLAGCAGLFAVGQGALVLYLYPVSEIVMSGFVIAASLLGPAAGEGALARLVAARRAALIASAVPPVKAGDEAQRPRPRRQGS